MTQIQTATKHTRYGGTITISLVTGVTARSERASIFVQPNKRSKSAYIRPSKEMAAHTPFFGVTTYAVTDDGRSSTDIYHFRQLTHAQGWFNEIT